MEKNKDIDGMVDVMVKDEDASRINRIVERFKLTTTDTAKLDTVITKAIEDRDAEKREKRDSRKVKRTTIRRFISKKPIQTEETSKVNFNMAKTEKNPLSEPSSTTFKMQEGVSNGKKETICKERTCRT